MGVERKSIDLGGFDTKAGALNLLQGCVGVRSGEQVLVIGEDGPNAFFDRAVCDEIALHVREIGAEVDIAIAPEIAGPEDFPADLSARMEAADHTIFFSRIGDQIRFTEQAGGGTKTMCYTRDVGYLGDAFGRVPHDLFVEVLARLMTAIEAASSYTIDCPRGTKLHGDLTAVRGARSEAEGIASQFTVNLFPTLIFPPVSCIGLSGQIALGKWLMSTSTNLYDDSLFKLDSAVTARVENGRIAGFDGDPAGVKRVEAHLLGLCGGDAEKAFQLNSWHTGIYPRTYFTGDPVENIESWGDIVFGNPRYTHLHLCGDDPGNVAFSIFDATIAFDGEAFWRDGRFVFLDRPDMQALLEKHNCPPKAFELRTDIGL